MFLIETAGKSLNRNEILKFIDFVLAFNVILVINDF